jgi:hypothetical protein
MNIHRLDNTNVGDWWSAPGRYFPFKPAPVVDIINSNQIPNNKRIYIVGGGLGRPFFREHLEKLKREVVMESLKPLNVQALMEND